jgi:hypothetical protein
MAACILATQNKKTLADLTVRLFYLSVIISEPGKRYSSHQSAFSSPFAFMYTGSTPPLPNKRKGHDTISHNRCNSSPGSGKLQPQF